MAKTHTYEAGAYFGLDMTNSSYSIGWSDAEEVWFLDIQVDNKTWSIKFRQDYIGRSWSAKIVKQHIFENIWRWQSRFGCLPTKNTMEIIAKDSASEFGLEVLSVE